MKLLQLPINFANPADVIFNLFFHYLFLSITYLITYLTSTIIIYPKLSILICYVLESQSLTLSDLDIDNMLSPVFIK
jgi:hypothetical protein